MIKKPKRENKIPINKLKLLDSSFGHPQVIPAKKDNIIPP